MCAEQAKKKQKKSGRFPPNWETMIRFLVILMKFSLIILGVGKYLFNGVIFFEKKKYNFIPLIIFLFQSHSI